MTTTERIEKFSGHIYTLDVMAGEYRVGVSAKGAIHAFRNEQPWRDCTGDQLVLALAQRVAELEARDGGEGFVYPPARQP